MNYQRIHDQIIERAKTRKLKGYRERHHINPRCLGGTDDLDNLVELTAREHFIIHKLLCEIYPNNNKLIYAYWMMCNMKSNTQNRSYLISSHEYERARLLFSYMHSNRIITPDTREKLRLARLGKTINMPNGPYTHTTEAREKIRNSKLGKKRGPLSEDQKTKMSLKLKGRKLSDDHKKKISEARKRKTNL